MQARCGVLLQAGGSVQIVLRRAPGAACWLSRDVGLLLDECHDICLLQRLVVLALAGQVPALGLPGRQPLNGRPLQLLAASGAGAAPTLQCSLRTDTVSLSVVPAHGPGQSGAPSPGLCSSLRVPGSTARGRPQLWHHARLAPSSRAFSTSAGVYAGAFLLALALVTPFFCRHRRRWSAAPAQELRAHQRPWHLGQLSLALQAACARSRAQGQLVGASRGLEGAGPSRPPALAPPGWPRPKSRQGQQRMGASCRRSSGPAGPASPDRHAGQAQARGAGCLSQRGAHRRHLGASWCSPASVAAWGGQRALARLRGVQAALEVCCKNSQAVLDVLSSASDLTPGLLHSSKQPAGHSSVCSSAGSLLASLCCAAATRSGVHAAGVANTALYSQRLGSCTLPSSSVAPHSTRTCQQCPRVRAGGGGRTRWPACSRQTVIG